MSENKTHYYKIVNSSVRMISEEEATDLFKNGVYHTKGSQIGDSTYELERFDTHNNVIGIDLVPTAEEIETVIFDFEKNSILPEVRWIDSYTKQPKGFGIIEYAVIGVIVVGTILYFALGDNSSDGEPEPASFIDNITNPLQQEPVSIVGEATETVIVSDVTPTEIEPVEVFNSGTDNFTQEQLNNLSIEILGKTYTISELNLRNANLEVLNEKLSNDVFEAKEEAKKYLSESLDKTGEIEILKSEIREPNQLYLYLGQYLFELCETQGPDATCKNLIFDYYNSLEKKLGEDDKR